MVNSDLLYEIKFGKKSDIECWICMILEVCETKLTFCYALVINILFLKKL